MVLRGARLAWNEGRVRARIATMGRAAVTPNRRNVLHWLSWAIALGWELLLTALLWDGRIFQWEQSLTRAIQERSWTLYAFDLTSWLTNTISPQFVVAWAFTVAVLALRHHFALAFLFFATFPLHVLAQFPKALIDRPRPSALFDGLDGVGGFRSFPSGHSEFAITFYGLIAFLAVRELRSPWAKAGVLGGWLAFVLATGLGRVAAGRHWPLDVMVSYVIGFGLLSGLLWLHHALTAPRQLAMRGPASHVTAQEATP